jgi:hypothetical protein
MKHIILALLLVLRAQSAEVTVADTRFLLDGKPFPWTGISFFNAIYNQEFNKDSETRKSWMRKFQKYGINVLRVWSQWDSKRGFVDTCPECSLYMPDGALRSERVRTLKQICADADALGMVVQVVLFSQESWHDGIRLDAPSADRAVAALTRELTPHRNVAMQIWNEFAERTVDHVKTIKMIDSRRLVTNSPGFGGVFTFPRGEAEVLDFLTPHTSRQGAGKHWQVAPAEIEYLLKRFGKPVVDDEPARNGTPQFGGPKGATSPYDHILQIYQVWKAGGHIVYHHDMFQMGKGAPSVPPTGIPDPEFNPYHRQVLEFIAQRERYQ